MSLPSYDYNNFDASNLNFNGSPIAYLIDGKQVSKSDYDSTLQSRRSGGNSAAGGGVVANSAPSGPSGSGSSFNLHPQPTSGNGPFGAVPGQLGLPDPAGDLAHQIPGLSSLNSAASSGILGKLNGQLSPGTLNALKNASAQFGVNSGMPGSGLSSNSFLGNVAGASEAQQAAGIQQYNSFVPTVSGTQTVNPALQADIANTNSINAAAPDPTQAASYAKSLFDKYLQSMRGGPGGGTGGGGPGGGASPEQQNRDMLAKYEADLDRKIALGRASRSGYVAPVIGAPSGPSSFGGSSSYDPNQWAQWEDELFGPSGPDTGTVSYGVLQPEFDPNYAPYSGGDYPDFALDDYLAY